MAFIQYLKFNGVALPLPTSYDCDLSAVEADTTGETEAGTTQRDVIRQGVVSISVTFSVSPTWLKKLTAYSKQDKKENFDKLHQSPTSVEWRVDRIQRGTMGRAGRVSSGRKQQSGDSGFQGCY